MKKLFAILLAIACAPIFAQNHERIIWHRTYFVSLGLDASLSLGGNLDGKSVLDADSEKKKKSLFLYRFLSVAACGNRREL